jgi:hypothetical protein
MGNRWSIHFSLAPFYRSWLSSIDATQEETDMDAPRVTVLDDARWESRDETLRFSTQLNERSVPSQITKECLTTRFHAPADQNFEDYRKTFLRNRCVIEVMIETAIQDTKAEAVQSITVFGDRVVLDLCA